MSPAARVTAPQEQTERQETASLEGQIGEGAGISWHYLDQYGETTLAKLRQATKLSEELLLMALGWLAREDKLVLVKDKRSLKISLKGK